MFKILVLLAVSLPFVFEPSAFAQSGTVKAGSQPIPGATVRATQGERSLVTLTDDNGAFRFDGMTPGAWVIEADMFGFDHLRREVQVASTPTNLDLTLQLSARAVVPAAPSRPAQNVQQADAAPNFPGSARGRRRIRSAGFRRQLQRGFPGERHRERRSAHESG